MVEDRRSFELMESIKEAERLFIEDFDTWDMTGYYLYSNIAEQVSELTLAHGGGDRLSYDALHALLDVDQRAANARPLHPNIFLFDDVLTSGKHFKCCESRLREVVNSETQISGLFVARRVVPNAFADSEVLE